MTCNNFVVHTDLFRIILLLNCFSCQCVFFSTDVVAGIVGAITGIQNVSPEKIPMGIIALWGFQNVLGLADTHSHVLRRDRGAVQRQFRQHGQTVHGQ